MPILTCPKKRGKGIRQLLSVAVLHFDYDIANLEKIRIADLIHKVLNTLRHGLVRINTYIPQINKRSGIAR